jgi:uncharacterized protein YjbK
MQEIEIEFKNLLTKNEFHTLCSAFKMTDSDFIEQDNHYFDTPDFILKEHQCALRIRVKQGKSTLTLKQPNEKGHLETHQTLTAIEREQMLRGLSFIDGQVKQILQEEGIPISKIKHLGTLTTKRAEINYHNGTLVFDHSRYFNKEDFEVEYEVSNEDAGLRQFEKLLHHFSIEKRTTPNKIRRFFKEKQRLSQK